MTSREDTDELLREMDTVLRDTDYGTIRNKIKDRIRAEQNGDHSSSRSVNTELHQAALNIDWKRLHELKNKGVDPNLLDKEGHTAEDMARNASLKAEKDGYHIVAREYRSVERYLMDYRVGLEKDKMQRLASRRPMPRSSISI